MLESTRAKGIVSVPSSKPVEQTVEHLKTILHAKGITLFAEIDHSGEAAKAGLRMLPTKLLIFGNPKGGTPVMLATPTAALDLPLKILVWQGADGKIWMSYNTSSYLQQRHDIPENLAANLDVIGALIATANE